MLLQKCYSPIISLWFYGYGVRFRGRERDYIFGHKCCSRTNKISAVVYNPPADVLMHDLDLGWTLTGSGNYNLSLQDLKVMMMITWYTCEFPAPSFLHKDHEPQVSYIKHYASLMQPHAQKKCLVCTVTPFESAKRLWNVIGQQRLQGRAVSGGRLRW